MTTITCNICGGTTFKPGHNGRITSTNRNPECITCGSVERQRIIHRVFSSLPKEWFSYSALLQMPKDKAIDHNLFHRVDTVAFENHDCINIQPLNIPYDTYDWISCNHILQRFIADTQVISELLRILRKGGVLQLCVPSPLIFEKTRDWGHPDSKISGSYRIYGRDMFERLFFLFGDHRVFSTTAEDPVTQTSDIIYLVTENPDVISYLLEHNEFHEIERPQQSQVASTGSSQLPALNVRVRNRAKIGTALRAYTYWETPSTSSIIPPYILLGLANMRRALGERFFLLTKSNLSGYLQGSQNNKDWRFSISSNLLTSELMSIVAKSDFLRMRTVYELGGIWMDADSIVLTNFAYMLDNLSHKLTWHSEQFFGALPGHDILRIASENMLKAPMQKWGNPGGIKDIIQRNQHEISHVNWKTLLDPNYKTPYNYKSYDIMVDTKVSASEFLCNTNQILLKMYNSGFMKYDIAKQTVDDFLNGDTLLAKIFLSLDPDKARWSEECSKLEALLAYRD